MDCEDVHLNLKLNAICRICLSEDLEQCRSLFEYEKSIFISDLVMQIADVKISSDDCFPAVICRLCFEELKVAHIFREKCEKSDIILRKFYINSVVKSTVGPTGAEKNEEIISDFLNEEDNIVDYLESECIVRRKKVKKRKKKRKIYKQEELQELLNDFKVNNNAAVVNDGRALIESVVELKQVIGNLPIDCNINKSEHSADYASLFECHLCRKPLKSNGSLQRHLRCMHKERGRKGVVTGYGLHRLFHCSECPYKTRHSQSLVYHTRIHSGERPHVCHVCDKKFTQPGSLNCHLKTHSDRTYFTCPQCGKQFKYRETYVKHQNVHVAEKKYICSICDQGLKSKKTLESHLNRHYNIKNFNCEMCGCTFVTHVELLNHAKKHATEKRFHCNLCHFKTNMKKSLESHLKRHTGEKQFKCELCEQACYTNGELKCHMRKHTREKNFSCPICRLGFIHSSSVNKHMFKTHGIKYSRNDHVDRRVIKPEVYHQEPMAAAS